MQLFYDPLITSQTLQENFTLSAEESWHAVKVLRLSAGEVIRVINGLGGCYTGEITKADPRSTVLKLLSADEEYQKRNHYLHIAVAPTKNMDRLEWFLEKATEIGIDEISLLICDRSERKEVKIDRLNKVIVSAMKQSLKAYLPKLNTPTRLGEFLATAGVSGQKFIAHCADGVRSDLRSLAITGGQYVVLIGPEGDFTPAEIQTATGTGYLPISLGDSRLRTETAALAACFEVNYLNRTDSR